MLKAASYANCFFIIRLRIRINIFEVLYKIRKKNLFYLSLCCYGYIIINNS